MAVSQDCGIQEDLFSLGKIQNRELWYDWNLFRSNPLIDHFILCLISLYGSVNIGNNLTKFASFPKGMCWSQSWSNGWKNLSHCLFIQ